MRSGRALFAIVLAFAATAAGPARADEEPLEARQAQARRLYAEGMEHFVAGRCGEALPLLVRASELVSSPNAGLLVARCLALEGNRVGAAARYADVERDALERVRAGETRYGETAAAAAKEGAALRARLGTIRVRGVGRVEIDGAPVARGGDADVVVLHEPGEATVAVGARGRSRTVRVSAGQETVVAADAEPAAAPAGPAGSAAPRAGAPWTFYAAGGVAAAGGLAFAGLGIASEVTYGRLESACGGRCGDERRAEADRGRAFQTGANIAVVVAIVGAVTAAVIWLAR